MPNSIFNIILFTDTLTPPKLSKQLHTFVVYAPQKKRVRIYKIQKAFATREDLEGAGSDTLTPPKLSKQLHTFVVYAPPKRKGSGFTKSKKPLLPGRI